MPEPSQPGDSSESQNSSGQLSNGDLPLPEPSTSQAVSATCEAAHWSADQVTDWIQKNVPFGHDRMREFLVTFQKEEIDGTGLLALEPTHAACQGLNDFEWLLLKVAVKKLLEGGNGNKLEGSFDTHNEEGACGNMYTASSKISHPMRSNSSTIIRKCAKSSGPAAPSRIFSFPILRWNSSNTTNKHPQMDSLVEQVQSLQGEVDNAEDREATLQAKLDHLDDILRTAQLASYIYTRMRWTPLPSELPTDDTDVDDWIQRFLVLQGSSIYFYIRASDFNPQGTFLLSEIIDSGSMSPCKHQKVEDKPWYAFYFTTSHGLRLECSTPSKIQMKSWLTSVKMDDQDKETKT